MKTCVRCGLVSPDSSVSCECGGSLMLGDQESLVPGRVAGFWVRVLSDALDALILGVLGFAIAAAFPGPLLALGERAVLIGAGISLVYSGVLQSYIGGGRTLGKRLLRLRVVRLDGQYLSLDRSLVRWSTMGILVYGGAIACALASVMPFLGAAALASLFGAAQLALFLGCVVLVPLHPLKRGLHDLLTGSIVLRGGALPGDFIQSRTNPSRDRRLAIAGIALACAAAVAGLCLVGRVPAKLQPMARVAAAMTDLGLQNPGVSQRSFQRGSRAHHVIIASGYLPTHADGSPRVEDAEGKILALLRKEVPLDDVDQLVVVLRRGVNLGIYRSYLTTKREEPPIENGGKP